jgi:hypothetical protein
MSAPTKATIASLSTTDGTKTCYSIYQCVVRHPRSGAYVDMNADTTVRIARFSTTDKPRSLRAADVNAFYLELARPYGTPEFPAGLVK